MSSSPQSHRFIHRVWQRMVAIRIAESLAIGMAIGAAAGLALMPLAWWADRPALPVAVAMLSIGAFAGLIRGVFSGPTHLQAALEADKQLNLHDLLGSVLLMQSLPSDDSTTWRDAVLAMAEDRCRSLRPGAVIVHRLGLRAWSGVGILSGLLLAIGVLITRPQASSAGFSTSHAIDSPSSSQNISESLSSHARPAGDNALNEQSSRNFPSVHPDSGSDSNASSKKNQSTTSKNAGGSNGNGQGLAITPTKSSDSSMLTDAAGQSLSSQTGDNSTGAGRETVSGSPSEKSGNGTASSASADKSVPPWQTTQWPADSAAAQNAIRQGSVPDADADLVRDYFKRE